MWTKGRRREGEAGGDEGGRGEWQGEQKEGRMRKGR